MTTDDRDGTLLPFPHVALPPSRDAGSGAPPDPGGATADDPLAPIPVGSWPLLPDVSDMGPPLHMTVAGVPDAEPGDDDEADAGAFVPPPPADPDNPGIRDVAVMGMAVMAAVGVACAQGMWHAAQGVKANAEQRRALADKARLSADKAVEKRMQSGPEFGKSGGGKGRSGGSGSGSSGGSGGSKVPGSLKANGPVKAPQRPSPSGSGPVAPKGPAGSGKGSTGPKNAPGGSGGGKSGPTKDRSSSKGGKDGGKVDLSKKPKSADAKDTKKGPDAKATRDKSSKTAKDDKAAKDVKAGKDTAGKSKPPKLPDPVSPWKGKPENKTGKAKDPKVDGSKDKKPDAKGEAKKADPKAGDKGGDKVDLTKKPKKAEAGKDKVPPKPLYDPKAKVPGAQKPDSEKPWKKAPKAPVNGGPKDGKPGATPPGTESTGPAGADSTPPPPPPPPGSPPGGPPPGGMPGADGMRPPPAYTDPEFKVWFEREAPPPPEPTPAGAITPGSPALPAGTVPAPPTASSTPPGPAAPAVPPQRGARFVSSPVKADTQYRDAELTVYDVIDADADMAEEITAGVDEALAAADGCERLVTRLEALHAKVVELKVPGVLEGMVIRLLEKTGEVKARADAIAAALPRASEAIATAGSNTEAIHRRPADVTRDMGHTRPAERDYNME
ncbi:hypothetical protein HRW16_19675 [Streptomyces lunaelactis]|uniref:hypothetical protein n=1 Tax=Streptomyces lunaelactis TaxID=1535768 RepID=UPI001584BFD7|nr:hypothetical protein [Streptomyces lunaelactis]NUK94012.1 hypothetical protein [Streptomyces lunaelactis]